MKKTDSKENIEEYKKLSQLFGKWIHHEFNSEHTRESYRISLRLYFKYFLKDYKHIAFGTFSLDKALGKSTIEEWESWMKDRGNTNQTINLRRSNLIAFLSFIADEDITYVKYFLDAKTIHCKKSTRTKQKALSATATEAIINAPDIHTKTGFRDTVLMGLMYCTGARLNEVLSVRIRDITIPDNENVTGSILFHGEGNKYRCMPLDENIMIQISLFIKRIHGTNPNPDSFLFFSPSKGKTSKLSSRAIQKRLKQHACSAHESCDEVPLDMHSHLFRHTRATNWVKERHRLPVVSKLLGHEHIETTMQYLDITLEMMDEAAASVRNPATNSIQQNWSEEDIDELFVF